MQMKNPRLLNAVILVLALSLVGCTSGQKDQETSDNTALIAAYLEVKDALVKTDANLASQGAENLTKVIEANSALPAELKQAAEAIATSTDVEVQRNHFNTLSQSMYSLVKNSEAEKLGLYKQYCPMAFNDTGAYWLASEKEINNPYFGDRMLRCGMVQEEL